MISSLLILVMVNCTGIQSPENAREYAEVVQDSSTLVVDSLIAFEAAKHNLTIRKNKNTSFTLQGYGYDHASLLYIFFETEAGECWLIHQVNDSAFETRKINYALKTINQILISEISDETDVQIGIVVGSQNLFFTCGISSGIVDLIDSLEQK